MKKQNVVSKTFTMPKELFDEFVVHCESNNLNRSAVIRSLILEYLNKSK